MIRRFVPSRRTLSTFAVGGAWFFIIVSLAHLAWVIGEKWGDPAGVTRLYHTEVGQRSYDAWGLSYDGTLGLLLAMGQALVVAGAAGASTLPWRRTLRYRRIGHCVLFAWAALWALGLLRLAALDHHLDSIAQATLLCMLLGCTGYRASMGWSPGRSPARSAPLAASPRLRAFVSATRHKTAAGLDRVGDFAHKQARRIAIR
jgi:hypothetical protein